MGVLAAQGRHLVRLVLGLDPFGDEREIEIMGEPGDRGHDGHRCRPVEVGDERAVDLDDVDGKAAEVAQR